MHGDLFLQPGHTLDYKTKPVKDATKDNKKPLIEVTNNQSAIACIGDMGSEQKY